MNIIKWTPATTGVDAVTFAILEQCAFVHRGYTLPNAGIWQLIIQGWIDAMNAGWTTVIYYALQEHDVIGVVRVQCRQGGIAHIQMLAVLPRAQGRGVGTMLLRFVLNSIKNADFTVNAPGMEAFYMKRGFTPVAGNEPSDYGKLILMRQR